MSWHSNANSERYSKHETKNDPLGKTENKMSMDNVPWNRKYYTHSPLRPPSPQRSYSIVKK